MTCPVRDDSRIIRPDVDGNPSFGLSKNPGDILMAKPSMPGTYAVFTSTSPLCSAIAMDRIGGMTTLPPASVRNACSMQSTAATSRLMARRSSGSVRIRIFGMSVVSHQVGVLAGDDPGVQVHVDVAAAEEHERGPARFHLARQKGRDAHRGAPSTIWRSRQ
jgi:hypothetical protein